MTLRYFKATDFRCLQSVEAAFDEAANLITGPNAAGKTSVLEGIAYLGRGKSFRGAETSRLVRHGAREFVLNGRVRVEDREVTLGVRNGPEGLETSVGGDRSGGAADLARALPLQVIDPDVHELVAGGPDQRRRFLDWAAFHVEHRYIEVWRRYRKLLRQRNACLKSGGGDLDSWDAELAAAGEVLAALQAGVFEVLGGVLSETAGRMLDGEVGFSLRRGWREGESLGAVLAAQRERDLQVGSTQAGPHRADLVLEYDERRARKLVSRGQQKLLAAAMVIGGVEVVQEITGQRLLLLMDDPAAELDPESLARLMAATARLGCQVIASSLAPIEGLFPEKPTLFHVEQGVLSAV